MIIQAFPSGPLQTNAYVAACQATKKAAIVDPAPGSFPSIDKFVKEHSLIPDKILLTHSHWDHIADLALFKAHFHLPIWVHRLDQANVENPGSDGLPCWIDIDGVQVDHQVEEGDCFSVGELKFQVIHTPGHSPGGVCYFIEEAKVLFSGDTLFQGTLGRLDLATGQPDLMWASLQKLVQLPQETVVYPGHGPKTTIGAEGWLAKAKEIFS